MRLIFVCILFSFAMIATAQEMPDIDTLEVISIENIHNLELLGEYNIADMPENAISNIHFNADSSRIIMLGFNGILWYINIDDSEIVTVSQYNAETAIYGFDTHPIDRDLMLLVGDLINIESKETVFEYPNYGNMFTADGQYVVAAHTLSDFETGELLDQWFEDSDSNDYPRQYYFGFDMSDTGDVIGLITVIERKNCCPWTIYRVYVVKNFDEWIQLPTEPYSNEIRSYIRVSSNGKWVAYLESTLSNLHDNHEQSIVVYSMDDIETPFIVGKRWMDFEFDIFSTLLIGNGWVFDLETQKSQELTIPGFYQVEFSDDGKLMVTNDQISIKVWGVPTVD